MDKNYYKKLFEKIYINNLEIKNRIVMPPMHTGYATEYGNITDRIINYYTERAKGGAGLIIVECAYIDLRGRSFHRQLAIDDDSRIDGLLKLTSSISKYNCKVAIQLHHGGSVATTGFNRVQPVSASPIAGPDGQMPAELDTISIMEIMELYALAAERAKKSGFDAIEIHAGHRYLFAQFLSSVWNKRNDKYGGDLQGRAKFLAETLGTIRNKIGPKYPLWCRINGKEYYGKKTDLTLSESIEISKILENVGADAIHVTCSPHSTIRFGPWSEPQAAMLPLAAAIKKNTSIPIIAVGRLTPPVAEKAICDHATDLIAMGRALIADPALPNKLTHGKHDDIFPCLGDGACMDFTFLDHGMRCMVNPRAGKEGDYLPIKTKLAKEVLVIGSGPGGLQASRVLALRGHKVVLLEKKSFLGGQLLLASLLPGKESLKTLLDILLRQIKELGVKVHLNYEITSENIAFITQDTIIMATGTNSIIPNIKGINNKNVTQIEEALYHWSSLGEKIVIIGGGLIGSELAIFLAEKGKEVTIIEKQYKVQNYAFRIYDKSIKNKLNAENVNIIMGANIKEIMPNGVAFVTKSLGAKFIQSHNIILATGGFQNRMLYKELHQKCDEIYVVGDSLYPRGILEAMDDAFRISCSI